MAGKWPLRVQMVVEAGSDDAEKLVPLKVYGRQREELPPAQAAVIGKMRRMIMRKISIR
jgi:hypothetical protein